jgi:hypothetical protein
MYTSIRSYSRLVLSALLMLACACPLLSKSAQAQDVLTFSSVSHNFGTAAPNSTPINYGVQVTNTSSTDDYVNFGVSLAGNSQFSTVNNCPASIAPGGTCEILFIFTPGNTGGTFTASWNITSGASNPTFMTSPILPGTLTAAISATAGLSLTTSAHNFGTQLAFTTGTTYGVVLTNSTQNPVALDVNLTPSGYQNFPFQHNAYNCPSTLSAGQSCNLQWQFYPNAGNGSGGQPTAFTAMFGISGVDTVTGQNVILTNSTGQQVQGVTLTGYGITGSNYLLMSTATHNFGNIPNGGSSSTYGIQLINTRPGAVTITVSESGSYNVFPITSDNCFTGSSSTTTLASGQSCQVQFYFHPTVTGAQSATYTLTASSGGSAVTILDQSTSTRVTGATLTGNSVGTTLTLTTAGHAFGPWVIGTTSTTYGTTLTYPLCSGPGCTTQDPINMTYAYTSGSNTADFNLVTNTCPAQLTAGSSCSLAWTFSPQVAGALSAVYNITGVDSVNHQPVTITAGGQIVQGVSLSGNGQANAELALATSTHNFGEQGVGGSSATYGTVLYNTTGAAVSLSFAYSNSGLAADFPGAIPPSNLPTNCPASMPTNTSCNIQFKFTPKTDGPLTVVYNITATQFGSSVPIIDLSTGNPANPPGVTLSGTGVN